MSHKKKLMFQTIVTTERLVNSKRYRRFMLSNERLDFGVSFPGAVMSFSPRSAHCEKPHATPVFYYDEEKNEYASNNVELISEPSAYTPAASLMERTTSSLSFFQNIVKTESSSALQLAWTVLLREMSDDLTDIAVKINSLQRSCKLKDQQLLENANAYDELQTQQESEIKKMLTQERESNTKITAQLENRVKQLEADLFDTMEIKNELVSKFNTLFRKRKSSKMKKEQLTQDVEDLSHEVEMQKDIIAQLKKALNTSKSEMEDECERSYQAGYKYGRHVSTLEELGVLEQFKILKEIEATLETDIQKENHLRRTKVK